MRAERSVVADTSAHCRGFTLLELLVVIAIMGVLASVVLASLTETRGKARDVHRIAAVSDIDRAIRMYELDHGEPPGREGVEYVNGSTDWIPGLVPDYIAVLPSDPVNVEPHKFRYYRQGNDYDVVALMEGSGNEEACADGGASCSFFEKGNGDLHTVSVAGSGGDVVAWTFESAEEVVASVGASTTPVPGEEVTPFVPLTLTAICTNTSGSMRFRVDNKNDVPIAATYRVYGTDDSGAVMVAARGTGTPKSGQGGEQDYTFFETVASTPQGTTLLSYVHDGVSYTPRKASNKTPCEGPSGNDAEQPSVPTELSAGAQVGGIALSWSASTDNVGVAEYRVYRDSVLVGSTPSTLYTDTGLADSTLYTYTVTARDAAGNESGHSSSVGTSTLASTPSSCPVTVTPTQASYVTGDDVQLSWDASCYPSSIVMLEVRKVTTGESSPFIMIYSAAPNDGDYPYQGFPSGLVGSDEWVVRVTDYNTRTNWDESMAFRVESDVASDTTPPSTPGYLFATMTPAYLASETDLFWGESTDTTGVTGYRLYRDGVPVAETTATTYRDTGLAPVTDYLYTVTAYDAAGNESPQSSSFLVTTITLDREAEQHATTTCPVTVTPTQASYVTGDDVQLSWDSSCYPSSKVMLEVRRVADGGSQSYIMIYSAANNTGTYPYQGFPSGLVGSDQWVVRVTDYNTRTNWDESMAFRVTN